MEEQLKHRFHKLTEALTEDLVQQGLITLGKREEMRRNPLSLTLARSAAMASAQASLSKAAADERARLRAAAGGRLRPCGGAGCLRAGGHRCAGCYGQVYCSRACQGAAWEEHREHCRETRKEFVTIILQKGFMDSKLKKGGHCTVQIYEIKQRQVDDNILVGDLMVKSENDTVYGSIARGDQEKVFDKIRSDIEEKGFQGKYGFYMALMKANHEEEEELEVEVNIEKMLPPEVWVEPQSEQRLSDRADSTLTSTSESEAEVEVRAESKAEEKIAEEEVVDKQQVAVPKAYIGAIIGPGGQRIRKIRADSKAGITIGEADEDDEEDEERVITIEGTQKQIQTALYMLQQAVKKQCKHAHCAQCALHTGTNGK